MDGKLGKTLYQILCKFALQWASVRLQTKTERYKIYQSIEQAFKDAGWLSPEEQFTYIGSEERELRQPVEGELASNPYRRYCICEECQEKAKEWDEICEVQLAHMKAKGWVKLPKDFGGQLDEKVFSGLHTGILEHAGSPVSIFLTSREIRAMTDNLLKLLSATK